MILKNKRGEAIALLVIVLIAAISAGFLIMHEGGITGFSVYSGDGACGSIVSSNSWLTGDVTGCTSEADWTFKINLSSVHFDCRTYKIGGTMADGIRVDTNTEVMIQDCNVTDTFSTAEYHFQNGATGYILSRDDTSTILVDDTSWVEIQWYVNISVKDASNAALSGASVSLAGTNGKSYGAVTTGANGIAQFNVSQKKIATGAVETSYNDYTITASKDALTNNTVTFTVTADTTVTVILASGGGTPTPDTTAPTDVLLINPNDKMINRSTTHAFNCSATDTINLANFTVMIWNSTGLYYNETTARVGLSNTSGWTITSIPDGNYSWNCNVRDNSSNLANATNNFTFTIDTVPPQWTGTANITTYNNHSISIQFNATDATSGMYCFYSNDTTFSMNCNGVLANATSPLGKITYMLNITVNDSAGNQNSTVMNITVLNSAPVQSLVSLSWAHDTNKSINLSQYFKDCDSDDINYSVEPLSITTNITISISNITKNITFVPDVTWYGIRYMIITATDGTDKTNSSNISLTVTQTPYCGDGTCNGAETTDDCCTDCGCASGYTCTSNVCAVTDNGGGGGGGGGGGDNPSPPPTPPAEPEAPAPPPPPPAEPPAPVSPDQSAVGDSFTAPSEGQTGSSCYQLNYTKLKEMGREDLIQKCNITDPYVDIIRDNYFDNNTNSTMIGLIIDPKATLYNFTYYENIPKCVALLIKAGYINESVIKFKNANFTVVKEDPLIMWQFAKIDKPIDLSYEVLNKKLLDDCLKLLQGLGLADAIETPQASPQESRKNLWIIISISALIVVMILYFSRFQKQDNEKETKQIVPNVKINKPVQQKQNPVIKPQPIKIRPVIQKPVANFQPITKPIHQKTSKEIINIANQLLKK